MKAVINYSEINTFVSKKIHQPICVSYAQNARIQVDYTLKKHIPIVGEVEQKVSIILKVKSVYSNEICFETESAKLIKPFLSMVLNSVASKNNLDFLSASGSDIHVRLDKIPGFSSILKYITPSVIEFSSYGIEIYAKIKC